MKHALSETTCTGVKEGHNTVLAATGFAMACANMMAAYRAYTTPVMHAVASKFQLLQLTESENHEVTAHDLSRSCDHNTAELDSRTVLIAVAMPYLKDAPQHHASSQQQGTQPQQRGGRSGAKHLQAVTRSESSAATQQSTCKRAQQNG
jgi:hypothetical protein